MSAHVQANPAADYLSRLEIRPENRIHIKLTDSVPVFHVEIDNPAETPKQEDEMDYYSHVEANENIRKYWSKHWISSKLSVQTEKEHPTPAENDVHQMRAKGNTGHRKTSVEDQMTFARVVNTSSLQLRAINSVIPSITVNLQAVQKTSRDIQKITAILSEHQTPSTHVNFASHCCKNRLQLQRTSKKHKALRSCQKDIV